MTAAAGSRQPLAAAPTEGAGPTACDLLLARRRRTFLRDWLLALAALAAAAAGGLFHGVPDPASPGAVQRAPAASPRLPRPSPATVPIRSTPSDA